MTASTSTATTPTATTPTASATPGSVGSSYSPTLRERADHLTALAARIERALVLSLPDELVAHVGPGGRGELIERLLERNLHQLHRAADDLRTTAFRFRARADELDAAWGTAA